MRMLPSPSFKPPRNCWVPVPMPWPWTPRARWRLPAPSGHGQAWWVAARWCQLHRMDGCMWRCESWYVGLEKPFDLDDINNGDSLNFGEMYMGKGLFKLCLWAKFSAAASVVLYFRSRSYSCSIHWILQLKHSDSKSLRRMEEESLEFLPLGETMKNYQGTPHQSQNCLEYEPPLMLLIPLGGLPAKWKKRFRWVTFATMPVPRNSQLI